MATYTPVVLSGSTNGKPIAVISTSSPGQTIHTVSTATGAVEDIFIDAFNNTGSERLLSVEFGATDALPLLTTKIPAQAGPYRVVAGLRLNGATGIVVGAFATATDGAIVLAGGVNRSV